MLEFVQCYRTQVRGNGTNYLASAFGERQPDGTWFGYLVFIPVGGGHAPMTDRETTQSTLRALSYWAESITPVYLEGALQRALALEPEAQLARRVHELGRLEADAEAEAAELDRAAARARAVAAITERERQEAARALEAARAQAAELPFSERPSPSRRSSGDH